MSLESVAKKVRLEKESNPERFCPSKNCLWRIRSWQWAGVDLKHNGCPRHGTAPFGRLLTQSQYDRLLAAGKIIATDEGKR